MRKYIKILGSLKLTVTLLVFSMLLVFFGTLDQTAIGIHKAQERYFESIVTYWPYSLPMGIPLPGGYLIGALLLINLSCAYPLYFRRTWTKIGVHFIHGGIILLLISGFISSFFQKESIMSIDEGGSSNYSHNSRINELVIIDKHHPDYDLEVNIPTDFLKINQTIEHEALPFAVKTKAYYPHAQLFPNPNKAFFEQVPGAYKVEVSQGVGNRMPMAILPRPVTYKENEINQATAIIELEGEDGKPIGSWLLSNTFSSNNIPLQSFEYAGKSYALTLRFKRSYKPYTFTLKEFSHDRYPGTDIPKNFSSLIQIQNPETQEDRQALIYMNHPLRYEGLAFYQHQFNSIRGKETTILQVVENPGWLLPYIAISLVGLGMLVQFIIHLVKYLERHTAA